MSKLVCDDCGASEDKLKPECMECGATEDDGCNLDDCDVCQGLPSQVGTYRCSECNEIVFGGGA